MYRQSIIIAIFSQYLAIAHKKKRSTSKYTSLGNTTIYIYHIRLNFIKVNKLFSACQLSTADHCTSVSDVVYRQRLRSASSHEGSVPRHRLSRLPMDVGHLPLLARLSGTLCPRTCVIRMFLSTVTGSH